MFANSFFTKRLILIHENQENRITLKVLLEEGRSIQVSRSVPTYEEALKTFAKDAPDICLFDIDGNADFKSRIEKLKAIRPMCMVIVFSNQASKEIVLSCIRSGAGGYLLKADGLMENVLLLQKVLSGGVALSRPIARIIVENFHCPSSALLTKREIEIVNLLAKQKTFSEISSLLFIARETAKAHIRNIYQKMNVNKKSAMISKAKAARIII